jgi:excinuclease UvrABC helicase subunit UvrB
VIIDESHVTVPQIGGMYNGDRQGRCRWSVQFRPRPRLTTGRLADEFEGKSPDDIRINDARKL